MITNEYITGSKIVIEIGNRMKKILSNVITAIPYAVVVGRLCCNLSHRAKRTCPGSDLSPIEVHRNRNKKEEILDCNHFTKSLHMVSVIDMVPDHECLHLGYHLPLAISQYRALGWLL